MAERGAEAEREASLDAVEAILAETGVRSLAPQLLETRSELASLLGDATSSTRLLEDAASLYREIGALGHLKRLAAAAPLAPS